MSILTNSIEANSFLGLVTKTQKKGGKAFARKAFTKIESNEVFMNLTIATVVIVMGLAAGSMSQQKIELARYAAPQIEAAV